MQPTRNEEPRSTIWSISTEDIGAYFGLYVVLYLLGSVAIVWLQVQRAGPVHEIVTGIITNMSLLGVGIAPTAAIVLTEIWGYAVILSRKLRLEVEAKEKRSCANLKPERSCYANRKPEIGSSRRELSEAKAAYEARSRHSNKVKTRTKRVRDGCREQ